MHMNTMPSLITTVENLISFLILDIAYLLQKYYTGNVSL